ncbi:probable mitogen-activated protein kinase kinase kinase 11 at C-terminar half [Coccomyxa sp. Obi]|nr:probable mitogen-activated protein kinase kinase kinase 11 at C-terminar half [Coccomyxa sp. Obi]
MGQDTCDLMEGFGYMGLPAEPRQAARSFSPHTSPLRHSRKDFLDDRPREPLDISTISFANPGGHSPGHIVQSIHHLLHSGANGSKADVRPLSSDLPRRQPAAGSGCPPCPPMPRTTMTRQDSRSLPDQTARQTISECPLQSRARSLPATSVPGCPPVPGLTWHKMLGCGSFASVFQGEWCGRQVAIKVLSSRGTGAAFSSDLFESLVSANMHHPNVVEAYEVLTVQQPAAPVEEQRSPCKERRSCDVLRSMLACSGAATSLEAAQQASDLDNIVSFFEDQRVSEQPLQETTSLAARNPRQNAAGRQSAFAAAAATSAPNPQPDTDTDTAGHTLQVNELRGILDREGHFMAARASSQPLMQSPFDTAICRALTADLSCVGTPPVAADDGGGCAGGPAGGPPVGPPGSGGCGAESGSALRDGSLRSITRNCLDASVMPAAARGFCRASEGSSTCGNSRSSNEPTCSWLGSSSASAVSPLPDPPLPPPPPPRSAQVLLLMELADQRSLHTAISKGRLSSNLEAILLCAMDIAAGMAYLHSMGVVHADLKPGNVLLMSAPVTDQDPRGFTCKIADFGMARHLAKGTSHAETDKVGSLPYVAPEVLQSGEVAKSADVYSFAVLLLEMWCGNAGFSNDNYHGVLYSVFYGQQPRVPDDTPAAFRALLQDCWVADPDKRPSFESVHTRLAAQLAAIKSSA